MGDYYENLAYHNFDCHWSSPVVVIFCHLDVTTPLTEPRLIEACLLPNPKCQKERGERGVRKNDLKFKGDLRGGVTSLEDDTFYPEDQTPEGTSFVGVSGP